MKKNITFLGKKVPITVILIAFLVISTASAAVYEHYATMEGDVMILSPITVSIDGNEIPLGGNYPFVIEDVMSPCTISETLDFNNTYGESLDVEIIWVLYETNAPIPLDASTSYWIWDNVTHPVPNGISDYTTSLEVPAYMIGGYTFSIAVNPVIV